MSYEYGQAPTTPVLPTTSLGAIRAASLLDPAVILAGQLAAELPDGTTLTANNGATAGVALDRNTTVINGVTLDALYRLAAPNHSFSFAAPASSSDVGEGSWYWWVGVRSSTMVGDPVAKRSATGVRLNLNSGNVFTGFAGADTVSTPYPLLTNQWHGLWVALIRDAETGSPGTLYAGDGMATTAQIQAAAKAVAAANLDDPAAPFMLGEMDGTDICAAILFRGAQLAGYDAADLAAAGQALSALMFSGPSQQLIGQITMEATTGGIFARPGMLSAIGSAAVSVNLTATVQRPDMFAPGSVDETGFRNTSNMTIADGNILSVPLDLQGLLTYDYFVSGVTSGANVDVFHVLVVGFGHQASPVLGTDLFGLTLERQVTSGSRLTSHDSRVHFDLFLGFGPITAAVNATSAPDTTYEWRERNAAMTFVAR